MKKKITQLTALFIAAALIGGCTSSTSTPSSGQEETTTVETENGIAVVTEEADGDDGTGAGAQTVTEEDGDASSTAAVSDAGTFSGGQILAETDLYDGADLTDDERMHVALVGAETFTDEDGETALRVYYEFTHYLSGYCLSADGETIPHAYQNGTELDSAYAGSEDVAEWLNWQEYVMPGSTMVDVEQYKIDPSAGDVEFTISGGFGEPLSYTFDLNNLPGRPALERPVDTMENSDFYDSYPATYERNDRNGYVESVFAFTGSEIVTANDEDYLRVYFDLIGEPPQLMLFQNGVLTDDAVSSEVLEEVQYQGFERHSDTTCSCYYDLKLRNDTPCVVTANPAMYWTAAAMSADVQ